MKVLPDYSEWLVGDRLTAEEDAWRNGQYYKRHVARLRNLAIQTNKLRPSLIEFGCGTGWVPFELGASVTYFGIDKNPGCLEIAMGRNADFGARFFLGDIRDFEGPTHDLVCSFAVLKHFGEREWESIFRKMLRHGRVGLFQLTTSTAESVDTGEDYHVFWPSLQMIAGCLTAEGHEEVFHEVIWADGPLEERYLCTQRKP